MAPLIQKEKDNGNIIVLANGCFDVIHVGHVRYLRTAKAQGNILVVALNSDRSVRNLKGPGRPILNQEERLEIISSFYFVDYVLIFSEPTVENILLSLKPHIHAKGSDYTQETVPEREIVKSYGGRIAITGGPKVRSTSGMISTIKK